MKKISRIKSYVDSLESEQLIGDKGFMLFCGGSLIMDSVMAVDKNKHITRNNKMQKAFDQIIGQGWLHYDAVEGVLNNEN